MEAARRQNSELRQGILILRAVFVIPCGILARIVCTVRRAREGWSEDFAFNRMEEGCHDRA
jgi:hypothetical protein